MRRDSVGKMKTLDEVIFEAPYSPTPWEADALHYLKEYQKDKQIYSYGIARRYLDLAERNDPLTWDELKTMEGKPVWVELLKGKWKGWDVIGGFDEDDFGVAMVTVHNDDYYKLDLGTTWQAYRKERE